MNDHIRKRYLYGGVSKDSSRIQEDQRRTDPVMDDARFENGCVTWELISPDEVKITDQTGDSMTVSVSEIA